MTKELIMALTEHRKFGFLFVPYIIIKAPGVSFYSAIEKANAVNIKDTESFNSHYEQILQLTGEYDDQVIASRFTKKKEDAIEFIKNVDHLVVEQRIRPSIERRLHRIIKILLNNNIRIFYKERNYAKIYLNDQIFIAGPKAGAIFNFERNSNGIEYYLSICAGNNIVNLRNKKGIIVTQEPCTLVLDHKLYIFDNIDHKKLLPFFEKNSIIIPRQTEKAYLEKFVLNTIRQYQVVAKGFTINQILEPPKPVLYFQNDLAGNPAFLMKYQYNTKVILPNNPEPVFVLLEHNNDNYTFTKVLRDINFEKNLVKKLNNIGVVTSDYSHFYPKNIMVFSPGVRFYETINWVNNNIEKINDLGIAFKQNYFDKKYLLDTVSINISIERNDDWFDIRGTVTLGNYTIPFIKLRRNLLKNIREYILPDGSVAILPLEWFTKYKEIFELGQTLNGNVSLNKAHYGLLQGVTNQIEPTKFKDIKLLFENSFNNNVDLPVGLNASLRPYQIAGYSWMYQLKEQNFGGCLADDMGLGKTLQTLALILQNSYQTVDLPLAAVKRHQPQLSLFEQPEQAAETCKGTPTSLVVMPSSLIHNWLNEAKRFTPKLKVYVHTGSNRTKNIYNFNNYDLVLTTYGLIRNDAEMLMQYPFYYLILDESQAIKNPGSKIYQSIVLLKSKYKLVITGTPIENSLIDLWSQMNFVNRGLLGNFSYFKNEFVMPIEKMADKVKSEKLKTIIHPFILRRTKEQVAADLPPKTEYVHYCDLLDDQRTLYEKEKSAVRNNILESMERQGTERSAMIVLQALTRLRQLANHPSLLNENMGSGKFDEVTRLLENIIAEKHKVLIFSSFVEHLKLYEEYLTNNNYIYSKLTGQTQNREQVIQNFQTNPDNHVFLISLKAGGVGLNLTAADYVFLLDPWWNPAAENQAINRAHRIGQDKKVFVYRFISVNTIEEKIVKLQERKSELAGLFINSNNPFKLLGPDKIKELFD